MENKNRYPIPDTRYPKRTLIMGVLNVTPDSFYDGGRYLSADSAIRHAEELVQEGADIIDVGGESTKPGSEPVNPDVELERVLPVIEKLANRIKVPISIDTQKAEIARQALNTGASMVNDISALRADPQMVNVVREHDVPIVLMHMKGTPKDMQENPYYDDVINEIKEFFKERIKWAKENGIREEKIIIDPGIGFGKRLEDNLVILKRLDEFKEFGRLVLVGPSRKSFITARDGGSRLAPLYGAEDESASTQGVAHANTQGVAHANTQGVAHANNSYRNKILRGRLFAAPSCKSKLIEWGLPREYFIGGAKEDRIWGTAGAVSVAVMNGADIIRVHDVAEMRQVVEVVNKIMCEVQPRTPSVTPMNGAHL